MKKPKLRELELLRAIAIITVVLIHGTSEGSSLGTFGRTGTQLLFLTVNRLGAFAVPMFLFISGVVLFYGAPEQWTAGEALRYCRRRMRTVLVPYLACSVFYYVINQWLAHGLDIRLDPLYAAKLLVTGNASYHLYFLVLIMQFYVMFPLLSWLIRRFHRGGRYLIQIGLACQLVWYGGEQLIGGSFRFDYLISLTYISFFLFGGWLGLDYSRRAESIARNRYVLMTAAVLAGIWYAGLYVLQEWNVTAPLVLYEAAYVAYALFAAAGILGVCRALQSHDRLNRGLASLGSASFGVYLIHPALLSLWRKAVPLQSGGFAYVLANTLGIIAVLASSWCIVAAYRAIKSRHRSTSSMPQAVSKF